MPVPQRSAGPIAFGGGLALFSSADDYDAVDLSKPIDVEIALSGQYKTRGFDLGTSHFEEIIRNHRGSGVDPAVDREHETWFADPGRPALGWVTGMRVEQATNDARRKALVAAVKLNDLGQQAVREGHFRYVSMGYVKAGKNPMTGAAIGAVLDHLALVKNPFIQGMRPLSLALSAQLGRLVEEEPMEQLAQKLREAFGLAADAPEEAIIAAFEKRAADDRAQALRNAAALTDREALNRSLEEQRRITVRLEGELERLSKDSDERATREWCGVVDQAVREFRLTPAEAEEYKGLSGAERSVTARLLAKRVPNKPAPPVETTPSGDLVRTGDLNLAAEKMVKEWLAANPGAREVDALMACSALKPELFPVEQEGV